MKIDKNQATLYICFFNRWNEHKLICDVCNKTDCNHPYDTLLVFNKNTKYNVLEPLYCTI